MTAGTQPTEPREITISNLNAHPVVFKVKTTAPKVAQSPRPTLTPNPLFPQSYWVRPNMGEIEPGESMVVKGTIIDPLSLVWFTRN